MYSPSVQTPLPKQESLRMPLSQVQPLGPSTMASATVFWLACIPAHPTQRLSHMLLCLPMSHRVCQVNARWAVCHALCAPCPSTHRCFAAGAVSHLCLIITVLYLLCLLRLWLFRFQNNINLYYKRLFLVSYQNGHWVRLSLCDCIWWSLSMKQVFQPSVCI